MIRAISRSVIPARKRSFASFQIATLSSSAALIPAISSSVFTVRRNLISSSISTNLAFPAAALSF
jgi:hypothetical protein